MRSKYTLLVISLGFVLVGHSQSLDLISVNPIAASNHVAINSNISFSFNMNIASATVNPDNIIVRGEQTGTISGAFSGGGTSTITFDPDNDFKSGEVVRVTITTGIETDMGLSLSSAFIFHFTTTSAASLNNPVFLGEQAPITLSSDFVQDVGAADIDGDGHLDVIGSYDENNLAWFKNDGNQNFTEMLIPTTISFARIPVADDLDGDGDVDLISGSSSDLTITWYENDGNENFTENILNASAGSVVNVYTSDLNGDGATDILIASRNQSTAANGKLSWLENDGSESFTLHQISSLSTTTAYPIDVDGDGDIDIVAGTRNEGFLAGPEDDRLIWFENDGSGNFILYNVSTERQFRDEVFAIDIDDDGDVDLLSAGALSFLGWYENDGNENFTEHELGPDVRQPTGVHASDVDGDGDIDILATKELDDEVVLFENDGDENFTERVITVCADLVRGVYAADMDGDGDLDVLSASAFDDKLTWYKNSEFQSFDFVSSNPAPYTNDALRDTDLSIEFNQNIASFTLDEIGPNGTGTIIVRGENSGIIEGSWSGGGTSTITFNPDNDLVAGEIIHVTITFKLFSEIGASLSNGDYSYQFTVGSQPGPESPPYFRERVLVDDSGSGELVQIIPADIDQDSDTDIVTISDGEGAELAWYNDDGEQSFTYNQIASETDIARGIMVIDRSITGHLDVLTAYEGKLKLYRNNEMQSFNSGSQILNTGTGDGVTGVYAMDMNGDGALNFLASSAYSNPDPVNDITIIEEEVEGYGFDQVTNSLNQPNGIYGADINRDGHNDLISWSLEGGQIGLYINDKTDNFNEQILATSFTGEILQVYPADLNDDGFVDLVANSLEALYWFEYDGDTYTEHLIDNNTLSTEGIHTADIDSDGDNDVIGVGESLVFDEECLFVLENDGTAGFTIHQFPTTSTDLSDTYVTDLDRDGDLDILASGRSGSKLIWFENTEDQVFNIEITSHPENQSACPGSEMSLQVSAEGAHNLSYQWQQDSGDGFADIQDGEGISGSTTASLGINSLSLGMNGFQYRCVVSGNFASDAISEIASLEIIKPISITTEPESITAEIGQSITFTTAATGDNITYQWKKGDVDLPEEISESLNITNVNSDNAGDYQVTLSNQCGSEASRVAVLDISVVSDLDRKSSRLQVYPNPASDFIVVEGLNPLNRVTLFSLDGTKVLSHFIGKSKIIDLRSLESGIYLLQLTDNDTHFEKIMIKR